MIPAIFRVKYRFLQAVATIIVFVWVQLGQMPSLESTGLISAKSSTDRVQRPSSTSRFFSPAAHKSSPSVNEGFCSEASYLKGGWYKRAKEITTLDELRAVYDLTPNAQIKCWGVNDDVDRQPEDPETMARAVEVGNYEWVPDNGCKKHALVKRDLIIRCLRSRSGLVMIGDSLTEHTYAGLWSLLYDAAEGLVIATGNPLHVFELLLNPSHPDYTQLVADSGVDLERAQRPFATFYRDHHALSKPELDEVFAGMLGYVPVTGRVLEEGEPRWIADQVMWWYGLLASQSKPVYFTTPTIYEEKTVLLFNIGPHWSLGELGKAMPQGNVGNGYTKLIEKIEEKVASLPAAEHVLSFWRATSPGDPGCQQYKEPHNNRTNHHSIIRPDDWQFNWDYYPEMNRQASSRYSYNPSSDPDKLNSHSGAMRYLNIWPLSISRPDAHLKPAIDCMHWCMPGVPSEWNHYLWHLMVIDARNK